MASEGYDYLEDSSLCDHLLKIRLGLDEEEEDLQEYV